MKDYDKINSHSLSLSLKLKSYANRMDGCGWFMMKNLIVHPQEVWWLVLKGFVGILVCLLLRSCCETTSYGVQHVQERSGEFQE